MDYDVLILGGGIIGCAVAYELSKYSLNIALIEKDYDIADDVALVNSSIVYDGIECENTLMSKLEMMGNKMFDDISSQINVPFKRCGSLFIAQNVKQEEVLYKIYNRAIDRGINNIEILNSEDIYELEPNLNIKLTKALYSKNTGIVCPYDLAIAYGEIAFDNGVKFKLEEEVIDIQQISKGFRVVTNKNKFTCKIVINTTPGQNYTIDSKEKVYTEKSNISYFLLENDFNVEFNNILNTFNEDNEFIYTVPTVQGNMIAAVNSSNDIGYSDTLKKISKVIGNIDENKINAFYKWPSYKDTIIIDESLIDKGYIKVVGKHYGQITMTPSIARIVCETIVSNTSCLPKKEFINKRREFYRFRDLTNEQRNKIIKMDNRYGRIICRCQKVTEGEIVDAIRRPLGARTVEGVKRRTGVTFGGCKGSDCFASIVSILARETNKKFTDIVKDSKNSKIIGSRIKEFN
ncbi:NAD(P)/FAD-dependent oxidoreductase [Clostridium rectalis]|uniref:NAD(P)/FAD-dependent oxidoreductase n=1 Tax=Clostridium rectalis TaxID=2040295 RepID=UPI000F640EC6|nr:FAD-dependent oxidoreductase [Clostridium rectalis]